MSDNLTMIRRQLTGQLLEALADTPAILINGARQTGKSTLARSEEIEGPRRQYLTFDDSGALQAARRDPNGFIAGLNTPVTLDEVQHVPEIFPVMKAAIDRKRQPGQFLLTGSANATLLPKLSESLAGRMEVLTLWPFSRGELDGVKEGFLDTLLSRKGVSWKGNPATPDKEALLESLLVGGYPVAVARQNAARRNAWFRSYVMTMLQRDVRDMANIGDVTAVPRLLSVVASRAGALLNSADLSRTMGLSQSTLKRYFALLESTFLVQPLRPWTKNLGQRVIHTPKLYLNDTGLLAFLLGLTAERLKADGGLTGALVENFVVTEVRKQATWTADPPEIFYWRTASGQEVDVVVEDNSGRIAGIEVKASATLSGSDVRGLQALAASAGKNWVRGVVLYTGAQVIPFGPNLHGVPMGHLWAG